MKKIKINGAKELSGTIKISGAKNSAVALIPASLLSDGIVTIDNVPNISDIDALNEILEYLGAKVLRDNERIIIDQTNLENKEIPEAKAKKLFEEAKKDPSEFAKLAKENSEDPTSAEKGGELGFFAANEMVPEFSKASFGAKPNTVVGPVKTQFGYHIIYVKDRMAAGQEPFEKVKTSIKDFLTNQKQLEQIDKLVESLKKNAKIEYVNKEYDPEYIQQKVQESIQKSGETAKQLKKEAEAKKQAAAQEKK